MYPLSSQVLGKTLIQQVSFFSFRHFQNVPDRCLLQKSMIFCLLSSSRNTAEYEIFLSSMWNTTSSEPEKKGWIWWGLNIKSFLLDVGPWNYTPKRETYPAKLEQENHRLKSVLGRDMLGPRRVYPCIRMYSVHLVDLLWSYGKCIRCFTMNCRLHVIMKDLPVMFKM